MEAYLLVYIIFIGLLLFINIKNYGFNGGSFLYSIYFIGSLFALILVLVTDFYDSNRLQLDAIIYHNVCLFLVLYPIVDISNRYLVNFELPSKQGVKIYNTIIIFLSILTFIAILPKISNIFSIGNFKEARNMYNYGLLEEDQDNSIISYLGGIGAVFSCFALYQAFYYIKNYPTKKKLIYIFLLCSLTDVFYSLSVVGRGGIIRWLFMLIFFYLSFKSYISQDIKRLIGRILVIFSIPILIIFIAITVSRFSDRQYPTYIYAMDYIGQSFVYFSYNFEQFFESTFGGRMNFPVFFPDDRLSRVYSELVYTDYSLNTFPTFIGSFYLDMGFVTTFLICLIFFILYLILYKLNRKPRQFYKLIVFIIFSQIIVNGVFYFQYSGTTKFRTFLLMIFFGLFIQFKFSKNKLARRI